MKNKSKTFVNVIVLFLVFLIIFLMNRLTLFTSDDFTYSFMYKGEYPQFPLEKINNLYDLFISQLNHWQVWNGRFVAHTIAQIFLRFPNIYFDFFNSLAFLFLGNIIFYKSILQKNTNTIQVY